MPIVTPTPCSSCGAPIVFALTSTPGRTMPIDYATYADDDTTANVAVRRDPERDDLVHCRVLKTGEQPDVDEHRTTSHFATCPHANQHRRSSHRKSASIRKLILTMPPEPHMYNGVTEPGDRHDPTDPESMAP